MISVYQPSNQPTNHPASQPACWGMRSFKLFQDRTGQGRTGSEDSTPSVNKFTLRGGASAPHHSIIATTSEECCSGGVGEWFWEWSASIGCLSSACLRWFFSVAADEIIIRGIYNSFHLASWLSASRGTGGSANLALLGPILSDYNLF